MSFVKLAQEKIQPGLGLGTGAREGAEPVGPLTLNVSLPGPLRGLRLRFRRARAWNSHGPATGMR